MPYTRKRRTYRRRAPARRVRRYRRKGFRARFNKLSVNRIKGAGFPDKIFVKLKYVENYTFLTSSQPYYNYIWRGNSVYDPNYTGTGHQPLYFDQYATIYQRYRVHAVKQILEISNYGTQDMVVSTILHSTDVTPWTSLSPMLEQTGARSSKVIPIANQYPTRIKYFVKSRVALGVSKVEYNDVSYASLVTTNPSREFYIHNNFTPSNGTADMGCNVISRMVYYVEFFDRKDIAQS